MLRSAAKNHASVTVVVDPADYLAVLDDIKEHDGNTCEMFRWKLAVKVFETTAAIRCSDCRSISARAKQRRSDRRAWSEERRAKRS